MKKLILLVFALTAMSFLSATLISYYGGITSFANIPFNSGEGWYLDRLAVVFEPADACVLNFVNIMFYQPETTGGNATATLCPFTGGAIDESGFPATSVTVNNADLVYYGTGVGYTTFDFTGYAESVRSFDAGEKFAIVLSCPNGVMNTTDIAALGSTASNGHSWCWYSDETPNWVLRTNVEWAFAADVTYTGNYIDLEATSLWFTGDMFLQPEDLVLYEADVTSNSDINVTGTVKIQVLDQATSTELWSQTWTGELFTPAEVKHYASTAPPGIAYPATEGDYQVILTVTLAGDMDNTNDMTDLEQITYAPPGLMDYTDDLDSEIPDNAYGWNTTNEGLEVGVDFWYYAAPLTLQTVGFRVWDETWPTGVVGHEFLKYAIYNWVEGSPNLLYVTPAAVPCVLGQWNDYDVSALGLSFEAGESFMVAYKQVGIYPACPAICVDETAPLSGWATSYFWDPDDQTWYLGGDEDFLIRIGAIETLGVEAPIISIALVDGYPEISWAEVTGAVSYNVYGSNDPYISDPLASPPWTPLITGTGDLGYQYTGTEPYEFFYVTASTEVDGSKMATQLKPVRAPKDKAIRVKAPRPETMLIEAVAK